MLWYTKIKEASLWGKDNILITPDKMEAYINIKYKPQNSYALKEQEYCRNLVLKKKKVSAYLGEDGEITIDKFIL